MRVQLTPIRGEFMILRRISGRRQAPLERRVLGHLLHVFPPVQL